MCIFYSKKHSRDLQVKVCRSLTNDIGNNDRYSCNIVAEDEGRETRYHLKTKHLKSIGGIFRA